MPPINFGQIQCSGGASTTNLGPPNGILNCRCPVGAVWINGKCTTCPSGTSVSNTGGSIPENNLCKCPVGQAWNPWRKACDNCPAGTSITNTGGPEMSVPACKCPAGSIRMNNQCVQCSAGQFQQAEQCIDCNYGSYTDSVGSTTCKPCPAGKTTPSRKSTNINACSLSSCPAGATPEGSGQVTSVPSCYCPDNNIWESNTCKKCPDGYGFDGKQCTKCLGMTTPIGMGGKVPVNPGCRCPMFQQRAAYDSTCHICPAGTDTSNTGGPTSVPFYCRCPAGQYYDNKKCNTGCPPGTNGTGGGLPAWGTYGGLPGCYCPTGESWSFETNSCQKCADVKTCTRNNNTRPCNIM